MNCFFRDDLLSDRIGFTYATWHGDDAAANLVNELAQLARDYDSSGNHAVLIALDGENAWEHYPFNGYYFLRALYTQLTNHPQLELTTLSECVARGLQPAPLPRVCAGSWVHGTLATWIGEPGKNRAWDLLCDAKEAYDRVMQDTAIDPAVRAGAGRQLALCEGSDWFWWFGDYNPADAVSQFDRLYRRQLVTLYRRLNLAPPGELSVPIAAGHGDPEHGGVMRRASA
jgi:alpha-amylase/alpha-mannosidase (GH57 family)